MTKQIAWSYSRLNDFEKCPRMFVGKHITKIFPKPTEEPAHFIKGRQVHDELERSIKTGSPLAADRAFLTKVIDAIKANPYYDAELKVAFDSQLNPVSFFDKNVWTRVIFDALSSPDQTSMIIIDWKTGKVQDKARDQLALFAAAAMAKFPKLQKVMTAYIWCDHPHAPPTYSEYVRDDCDRLWREFGDRAELIQLANESGNWEPKPGPFNCKWCPALPSQCEFKARYS